MKQYQLTAELLQKYSEINRDIAARLSQFRSVPKEQYFYELCYCICTPQSKAKNAGEVQRILMEMDFQNNPFDPTEILREPRQYIRFHNQKSLSLLRARDEFPEILKVLDSDLNNYEKRDWLAANFKGFGMKESSHFLRNIGYTGLAILDRHILRNMTNCGIYDELPTIKSAAHYREIEKDLLNFSIQAKINFDELDLLFWANSTGEILK